MDAENSSGMVGSTPVFGVLLSALLLGETDQASGIFSLISLVLVCTGIYIVNSVKKY